ncbi:hypothetical protein [Dyella flagellata]|uniref:Uncharacterized protein n=1 Tax=Dyella flagellata TaxID=1867833 RepID=A0ABQ5XDE7_9GAMM|nr:hypothetical protein [Dyella flagellata]GLQ89512.1 hypothetical protein GCM10007898_30860 [Dyella flagellata]
MTGLSQRIVDYVAELTPLFTFQFADGHDCALSLTDGSLYMPVDESGHEKEEGWVTVLWQGDAHRRSELPGPLLAYQAALRCAQLHGIGKPPWEVSAHLEILLARLRAICGGLPSFEAILRT